MFLFRFKKNIHPNDSQRILPQIDMLIVAFCTETARIIQEIRTNHHIAVWFSLLIQTDLCWSLEFVDPLNLLIFRTYSIHFDTKIFNNISWQTANSGFLQQSGSHASAFKYSLVWVPPNIQNNSERTTHTWTWHYSIFQEHGKYMWCPLATCLETFWAQLKHFANEKNCWIVAFNELRLFLLWIIEKIANKFDRFFILLKNCWKNHIIDKIQFNRNKRKANGDVMRSNNVLDANWIVYMDIWRPCCAVVWMYTLPWCRVIKKCPKQ